jgi:hypothetical protein
MSEVCRRVAWAVRTWLLAFRARRQALSILVVATIVLVPTACTRTGSQKVATGNGGIVQVPRPLTEAEETEARDGRTEFSRRWVKLPCYGGSGEKVRSTGRLVVHIRQNGRGLVYWIEKLEPVSPTDAGRGILAVSGTHYGGTRYLDSREAVRLKQGDRTVAQFGVKPSREPRIWDCVTEVVDLAKLLARMLKAPAL